MRAAIIIPARFASTRLPGKPLLDKTGKPLVQHTYEQAVRSKADKVIIATDDERIATAARAFGADVALTDEKHESGTMRVAEVARDLDADIIVNLQGDEPDVDPDHLDMVIAAQKTSGAFASTLACPFPSNAVSGPGSPEDPSAVKAILSAPEESNGLRDALFFLRDLAAWPKTPNGAIAHPSHFFLHIGVYAFSTESLQRFTVTPPGILERSARLEQLRILEAGERIAVSLVDSAAPGIDTPDDYADFVARHAAKK